MNISVGIDIVEVDRFRAALKKKKRHFIETVFSVKEREYCYSYKDPAPHLAGMFAAKEAVRKATGLMQLPFTVCEIRHTPTGKPQVWLRGRKDLSISISISHSTSAACAVALKCSRSAR